MKVDLFFILKNKTKFDRGSYVSSTSHATEFDIGYFILILYNIFFHISL